MTTTQTLEMLSKIEHETSAQLCTAERSLLYYLEGGCQVYTVHCPHSVCLKALGSREPNPTRSLLRSPWGSTRRWTATR